MFRCCLLTHRIHISAHYQLVTSEVSAYEVQGGQRWREDRICAGKAQISPSSATSASVCQVRLTYKSKVCLYDLFICPSHKSGMFYMRQIKDLVCIFETDALAYFKGGVYYFSLISRQRLSVVLLWVNAKRIWISCKNECSWMIICNIFSLSVCLSVCLFYIFSKHI